MPSLRKSIPRSTFARWKPSAQRRDPNDIIAENERGRIPALLALRHERMSANAFGYYRGCAAVMAADLATMPVTGFEVQLCGDAHVMNYGGFATPERRLVFDVNDFDETLRGPWEWDVARLCASLPLAASYRKFRKRYGMAAAMMAARGYRVKMAELAKLSPLDIFYSSVDVKGMLAGELTPPQVATRVKPTAEMTTLAEDMVMRYQDTLNPHVRQLVERYHVVESFEHPVGVGSVGLLTVIVHCEAEPGQPLFLQVKEAVASVLEPYLGPSRFDNHGQRVVNGQWAMQAASDPFLGWTINDGHDYYVRQLRDMKASLNLDGIDADQLVDYAARCGAVLARAHARTGEPAQIAEYLGTKSVFEESMASFGLRYAAQVELDYEAFLKRT